MKFNKISFTDKFQITYEMIFNNLDKNQQKILADNHTKNIFNMKVKIDFVDELKHRNAIFIKIHNNDRELCDVRNITRKVKFRNFDPYNSIIEFSYKNRINFDLSTIIKNITLTLSISKHNYNEFSDVTFIELLYNEVNECVGYACPKINIEDIFIPKETNTIMFMDETKDFLFKHHRVKILSTLYEFLTNPKFTVIDVYFDDYNLSNLYADIIENDSVFTLEILYKNNSGEAKENLLKLFNDDIDLFIKQKKIMRFILTNFSNEFLDWFTSELYNSTEDKTTKDILLLLIVEFDLDFDLFNPDHISNFKNSELIHLCKYIQKRNSVMPTGTFYFDFEWNQNEMEYLLQLFNNKSINFNLTSNFHYELLKKHINTHGLINFIKSIYKVNKQLFSFINNNILFQLIGSNKLEILNEIFNDLDVILNLEDFIINTTNSDILSLLFNYCYRNNYFINVVVKVCPYPHYNDKNIESYKKYFDYFNLDSSYYNQLFEFRYQQKFIIDNFDLSKFNIDDIKYGVNDNIRQLFKEKLIAQNQKRIKSANKI